MQVLLPALSAIVPGLGQLLRGRVSDGLLFLFFALWLRVTLGGLAWTAGVGDRLLDVALWGFPALPAGQRVPLSVLATVMAVVVHAWAALDARRPRAPRPAAT